MKNTGRYDEVITALVKNNEMEITEESMDMLLKAAKKYYEKLKYDSALLAKYASRKTVRKIDVELALDYL